VKKFCGYGAVADELLPLPHKAAGAAWKLLQQPQLLPHLDVLRAQAFRLRFFRPEKTSNSPWKMELESAACSPHNPAGFRRK